MTAFVFPDLPPCLDRKINGIRAVPTTNFSKGDLIMSLEQEIATLTAAVKELTTVLKGKKTEGGDTTGATTPTKSKDEGAAPGKGDGKKSGEGKGAAKEVSYPEVSAIITKLAKEKGREKALEVLGEFNVANGKDLKKGDYAAFLEKATEALNAEEDELA